MKTLMESAAAAKAAAAEVAQLSTETKNKALLAMADALEAHMAEILAANAADMDRERANGMSPDMLDRLMLNEGRVRDMAVGLRQVAELPDPIGEVISEWDRPNGLHIKKVRVPMGVIGIIYEARPNVTVDAASLAFKAGSAILLRGSGSAYESNAAEVRVLRSALESCGVTPDAVCLVEEKGHDVVDKMLTLRGYIDLIIPRGSARLINNAVDKATVPILQTGTGNCHVYVDESADYAMAEAITVNAKTQRTSVCNCAETLLVQEDWAERHLKDLLKALTDRNVELHGDEPAAKYTTGMIPATEADWADEYLRLAMAVKVVPDVKAAVEHINHYGTMHTECIVTENRENAEYFLKNVDAAVVDWNASTRFTDGFEFGFGAELGISTQKLHARGPMGLTEITSYKYLVIGTGQVRP
ncbi:MAG TPA: glutamate-5-semialdehyde dehydrogenase [Candidatus Scatomorpha intestinavium]|uniref:Gamma-glutamyl phosphate reductase n=1 Tax=Candidatus Scatomorpha intestinavium TaxID=2840922 RepID=A0A9D0ZEW4_9FIRM|nr:glutamate-5-semialdehyde dehydrogenase [Candidatus Scatomorpha intestinavium]